MKTKTVMTHLAISLVVILLLVPQAVNAATYTQIPQPQELWRKDVVSWVYSIAFSPDGTKIAAGVGGKVAVFSSFGDKLWESNYLNGTIYSIAWSPDGSRIAVGVRVSREVGDDTWNYSGSVIVLSSLDGRKLWERSDLTNGVYSVAWSPDGTKIAVGGAFDRVVVFSSKGDELWESRDLGRTVESVAFSPDGTKIMAGGGFGIVIISSSNGSILLWEKKVYDVNSVTWSPDGTKIAAGLNNGSVIVFSSTGIKLWEKYLGGWIYSVAFSSDNNKIVVGNGGLLSGKIYVLSPLNGSILWESEYLDDSVYSVTFSPDGTKIAAGVGLNIIVFSWPGHHFGVIKVSGVSFSCKVCFFDGSVTNCYRLNSTGLTLYADPGNYEVRYYLTNLPFGYKFVGNASTYFNNNPIIDYLNITGTGNYSLESPKLEDFLSGLGKLIVHGLVNSTVKVVWGYVESPIYTIPPNGTLVLYAVPGVTYTVYVTPPDGGLVYVSEVNISEGGEIKELNVTEFPTTTTSTSVPKTTTTTTTSPNYVTTSSTTTWNTTTTTTTTTSESASPGVASFGLLPLFLVIGIGAIGGAVFVVARGRRGGGSGVGAVGGHGGGPASGGADYGSIISEAIGVLRSSRDIGRASSLLSRVREFCSGAGAGSEVCGGLGGAEALLRVAGRVDELLVVGRDSSRPVGARLRALEEALRLCREHGLGCSDVESALAGVRGELSGVSARVRGLVESARALLGSDDGVGALDKVSEAVKLCEEAGVAGLVEECGVAEGIRERLAGIKEFLESGVSVGPEPGASIVEGSPTVLEVVARAPASLREPVEGGYLDFTSAEGAGLVVREGRVRLPPIGPGGTASVRVEAVPSRAGSLRVPFSACVEGVMCVGKYLDLDVSPKPPAAPAAVPEVSLADAYELLRVPVGGLVSGYGCVEGSSPKEAVLRSGIAPDGFEGAWSCCPLGCGGWGCAYLCRREGREVVFKVPRGFEGIIEGGFVPTVHARLLKRVRDEAEVLRALKHPNILRVLGVARAAPVLAYEFGDGGSAEWQLSRGWEPSLRDAVLFGIQVGDALRYIHSRGLVHGDIKPGNVFFVGGVAKVGDFSSIVRLVTMTSRYSRMAYTPGFRSPEQVYADLRRKVKELGIESRIDTYLLGNTLLYIMTAESVDGEDAVDPATVDEAVAPVEHEGLRRLIRSMLDPDPLKRPSTEEVVKKLLKIWATLSLR